MSCGGGSSGSKVPALGWREEESGESRRDSGTELLGEESGTGSNPRRPRGEKGGGRVDASSPQGISVEPVPSGGTSASVPVPGTSDRRGALQS